MPQTNSSDKRLIYIDMVRVLAIFFVVFHHIHFHILESKLLNISQLWSNYIFGLSYGDLGVSLFIVISGLGLTLSQSKYKFNVNIFYRNRIKKIYPLFLLIFIFFFTWYWFKSYLQFPIDLKYFILTLSGLDTYLISFFKIKSYSFYDWFIGFILLFYIIYPLLYKIYTKSLILLIFLSTALIPISIIIFGSNLNYRLLSLRILEFVLGMSYSKYAKNTNKFHVTILLVSLALLYLSISVNIQDKYNVYIYLIKLISTDFVLIELLYFLSKILNHSTSIKKIIIYLSSISYAIFLLHHQLIIRIIYDFLIIYKDNLNSFNSVAIILITILTGIILLAIFFSKIEMLVRNFILKKLQDKDKQQN